MKEGIEVVRARVVCHRCQQRVVIILIPARLYDPVTNLPRSRNYRRLCSHCKQSLRSDGFGAHHHHISSSLKRMDEIHEEIRLKIFREQVKILTQQEIAEIAHTILPPLGYLPHTKDETENAFRWED